VINAKYILKVKIFALLLFVFSIPFENWNPFGISSFFSVTKMAGVVYAVMAILLPKMSFSFERQVFLPFKVLGLFYLLLSLISIFNYNGQNQLSPVNFTLFQNIISYWLIASDLNKRNVNMNKIFLSFTFSIILMGILIVLGIGLGSEYVEGETRLTFFNNNANMLGVFTGVALTFTIYFILNSHQTYGNKVYLLLFSLPLFVNMLLSSGSRGALISTVLSVLTLILLNRDKKYKKMIQYLVLILGGSFLLDKLMESNVMYERILITVEMGSLGERDTLWRDALKIFNESPFIGNGSTGFERRMIIVYGRFQDTHNLFLYIMATTGIIGLMIFFYFLYFHLKASVRTYAKERNPIKLIILLFYITTVIKAGGVINSKLMWLLLALIIALPVKFDKKQIITKS